MKKSLIFLLTLTMVISMAAIAPFGVYAEEEKLPVGMVPADYKPEGTAVSTAEEFAAMDPAGKYYLAADITLSETYLDDFTGTFDGNGKKVKTTVPLFDAFDGIAMNLVIDGNIVEYVGSATSEQYVGAFANIAGHTAATSLTNIRNNATVTSEVGGMGGLVGMASNDQDFKIVITNCANYGSIVGGHPTSTGIDNGGIVGMYDGNDNPAGDPVYTLELIGCSNYGTINAGGRPGGIIGYANASTRFVDCYNAGDIQSTKNYCGGIAGRIGTDSGYNNDFYFENCVNDGDVIVFKSQGGGVVGWSGAANRITFKNCTNNGNVYGFNPSIRYRFGGIFGAGDGSHVNEVIFDGCVNNGVIGDKNTNSDGYRVAGGMTGKAEANNVVKFVNCINNGEVVVRHNKDARAGGMAGQMYIKNRNRPVLINCINNGDVSANNKVGGLIGTFGGSVNSAGSVIFDRCGNAGNITALNNNSNAGGFVGYMWAGYEDNGPIYATVKNSFNTGDITSKGFSSGFIAYMNAPYAEFEYNYVAGKITGKEAVALETDMKVWPQECFSYEGTSGTRYFLAPAKGTVSISGDTVTFTADSEVIPTEIDRSAIEAGYVSARGEFIKFNLDGQYYAVHVCAKGTVKLTDATTPVVTVTTEAGGQFDLLCAKWDLQADNKTLTLTTFDHSVRSAALCWSNNCGFIVDMNKNKIAEGTADFDYVMGFGNKFNLVGGIPDGKGTRVALADFASGKVTYDLNKLSGKEVFYQNLDPAIFVVDKYPTTDASHAKVILSGGAYTNALFDMNDNGTTPPTGDATIYVVAALAVSAIALATVVLVRKKKVND